MATRRGGPPVRFESVKEGPMKFRSSSRKLATTVMVVLGAAAALLAQARPASHGTAHIGASIQYRITTLPFLGGTIARGNSINDQGWVSGYSFLSGNLDRHA